jgi:hypothetical protein
MQVCRIKKRYSIKAVKRIRRKEARMHALFFFIVLFSFSLANCPVPLNKTSYTKAEQNAFYHYSYSECQKYPKCVDAFFLDTYFASYEYFRVRLEIFMSQSDLNISSSCSFDPYWPNVMALNKVCETNEVWDPYDGCKCRPDKICKENSPADLQLSSIIKIVIAVALGAFFVYYSKATLSKKQQ